MADHVTHENVVLEGAFTTVKHFDAVAQHGDAVGDFEDLVELVADEDHRDAGAAQLADDVEQPGYLAGGQRRRRLVHDNQLGIAGKRAGDGDELALGDREFLGPLVEFDRHPDPRERGAGDGAHPLPAQERPTGRHLALKSDVLKHREVGEQRKVLVDHLDAGGDGVNRTPAPLRSAVDGDLAAVGRLDARQKS